MGTSPDLKSRTPTWIPTFSLTFENLTLHFTPPFLHGIGDWTNHALDETWLPHLKSFQLTDPRGVSGDSKVMYWNQYHGRETCRAFLESSFPRRLT